MLWKATTTLRAFHGDLAIKVDHREGLEWCLEQDRIEREGISEGDPRKDAYHRSSISCTFEMDAPVVFESILGIPAALVYLHNDILENMPAAASPQLAVDFFEAVAIGADLSLVAPKFLYWLLMNEEDGLIRLAKNADAVAAIQDAGDLVWCFLSGEAIPSEQWETARDAIIGGDGLFTDAYLDVHRFAIYAAAVAVSGDSDVER